MSFMSVTRGDIPGVEGLVEGGGVVEHAVHASYSRDVPGVEGLVEGGGAVEHAFMLVTEETSQR